MLIVGIMSVEKNTEGTFEHNKSLLKRALLATTCLQQSGRKSARKGKNARLQVPKCLITCNSREKTKQGSNSAATFTIVS